MYSIEQLQALDYLLKRITNNDSYRLCGRNLKLVVEINNALWYGDFVQMKNSFASKLFIDDGGDIEQENYSPNGSNKCSILKKIWAAYNKTAGTDTTNVFWNNPFRQMDSLPLLFETLLKILEESCISTESSPFYPYLLNAHSVDGKSQLPFINLAGERIKLVSIKEVD